MLGKLRQDYTPIQVPAEPRTRLTGNLSGAIAAPSPARALQEQLELRTGTAFEDKWSARRSLALIIASASMLWLAVLAAGTGMMHVIA
jgi:hypothetical protein